MDDLNSVDETEDYNPPPFMCLVESEASNSPEVTISLISICPATGDVLWDEFKGAFLAGCSQRPRLMNNLLARYPDAN